MKKKIYRAIAIICSVCVLLSSLMVGISFMVSAETPEKYLQLELHSKLTAATEGESIRGSGSAPWTNALLYPENANATAVAEIAPTGFSAMGARLNYNSEITSDFGRTYEFNLRLSDAVESAQNYKGFFFYLEMPTIGEPNKIAVSAEDAIDPWNDNGRLILGEKVNILTKDGWSTTEVILGFNYYTTGIELPDGFKGYIYLPFTAFDTETDDIAQFMFNIWKMGGDKSVLFGPMYMVTGGEVGGLYAQIGGELDQDGNPYVRNLFTAEGYGNTKPEASKNADLSKLTINGGKLNQSFTAAGTEYTASVASNINSITVTPVSSDINATITVNGKAVSSGSTSESIDVSGESTVITVKVTAEDGTTEKTYTVTVTHLEAYLKLDVMSRLNEAAVGDRISGSGSEPWKNALIYPENGMVFATACKPLSGFEMNGATLSSAQPITSDFSRGHEINLRLVEAPVDVGNTVGFFFYLKMPTIGSDNKIAFFTSDALAPWDDDAVLKKDAPVYLLDMYGTWSTIYASAEGFGFYGTGIEIADGYEGFVYIPLSSYSHTITKLSQFMFNIEQFGGAGKDVVFGPMYAVNGGSPDGVTAQFNGEVDTNNEPYLRNILTGAPVSEGEVVKSNDSRLSKLTIDKAILDPAFSSETLNYTSIVVNNIDKVTISPRASHIYASLTFNGEEILSGASKEVELTVGDNVFEIIVTAQDGITTRKYTVTINRAEPLPKVLVIDKAGDLSDINIDDNIIDSGKVNLFDFVDANASASVVDVNEALGLKGVKVESDPFDSGWVENSDTLTRTKETKFKLNISSTTGYTGLVFYIKLPKTGTGKNMIAVHVDDYPTLTTKISAGSPVFYLKKGETAWSKTTAYWVGNYPSAFTLPDGFEGYIQLPFSSFETTVTQIMTLAFNVMKLGGEDCSMTVGPFWLTGNDVRSKDGAWIDREADNDGNPVYRNLFTGEIMDESDLKGSIKGPQIGSMISDLPECTYDPSSQWWHYVSFVKMSDGKVKLSWPEAMDNPVNYRLDIYNTDVNDSGDTVYVCISSQTTTENQIILSNLKEDENYYASLHSLSETELLGTYKYANIYVDSRLDYYSDKNEDTVINITTGNNSFGSNSGSNGSSNEVPSTGERSNIEIMLLIFASAAALMLISAYKIHTLRKEG